MVSEHGTTARHCAVGAGIPQPTGDSALEELKAIYQAYPNDDLADLIDSYSRDGL